MSNTPLIQKCFGPGTNEIVDGVTPSCELFIPCVLNSKIEMPNLVAMYTVQDPSPGGSLQSPAYSPHCERAVLTPTDPLCLKAVQPGSMRSFQVPVQYLQIGLLFRYFVLYGSVFRIWIR